MIRFSFVSTLVLHLLLLLFLRRAEPFTVRPTRWQPCSLSSSSLSPLTLREAVADTTGTAGSGRKRRRSRVTDPAGETEPPQAVEPETIQLEDIKELHYDPNVHPIPHQPWRRGVTDGCEDPIDAEWRKEAEGIIRHAVDSTGAKFFDVTWFLTAVVVSISGDFSAMPDNMLKTSGPPINTKLRQSRVYKHPDDPNPEDIWLDDELVFDNDDDEPGVEPSKDPPKDVKPDPHPQKKPTMATGDVLAGHGEGPNEEDYAEENIPPPYESIEERAARPPKDPQISDEEDIDTGFVDDDKVSTIAGAILDSLETVESRLRILDRHELVLASPGSPFVIETQKQFDKYRGTNVAVDTQDPWESNRTIRGKLYDRNSMDVILSQNGRLVTIPNNFVRCVRRKANFREREQVAAAAAKKKDDHDDELDGDHDDELDGDHDDELDEEELIGKFF